MEWIYQSEGERILAHATPIIVVSLTILVVAYRYYSAFIAAKVACLDDRRLTPANTVSDGQNFHPTNRWVLFGHHFAAISGAGPLIGPVLALQYGYLPGLIWLVIGVCLAGAVQDMLILAASVRRGGKSLAEIVRIELGPWAHMAASAAILFIIIIALAGLGFVVIKALGGERVPLPSGVELHVDEASQIQEFGDIDKARMIFFPKGTRITLESGQQFFRPESFTVQLPTSAPLHSDRTINLGNGQFQLPPGSVQIIPGSSWGLFTIACTIPIAFFVSGYMYWLRPGKVLEASTLGGFLVLAATWGGSQVPGSVLEPWFQLSQGRTLWVLCLYGFVASILPVWLLLCPRDYISSFLKIGTIALLVVGTCLANPLLLHKPVEPIFAAGGPTFKGGIYPFVFICVMCGAVSGFHALVSSGTTPKMIERESDIRQIGYGAMLLEGVVGIVALISAASLDPRLYYDINTDLRRIGEFQGQIDRLHQELGASGSLQHLDISQVEDRVEESLRGRVGGAVTLAVGMAQILTKPLEKLGVEEVTLFKYWKYWYHFAIMFEALFILTTIDTGTRIARFLVQETVGRFNATWGRTNWLPGAILSSFLVTAAWGGLVATGSIDTIWPMFGIANQLLAVLALATVVVIIGKTRRRRYLWVLLLPLGFVLLTTVTASYQMVFYRFPVMMENPITRLAGVLSLLATVFVISAVGVFLFMALSRLLIALQKPGDDKAF